jgi:polar amino acid transport system permease protein
MTDRKIFVEMKNGKRQGKHGGLPLHITRKMKFKITRLDILILLFLTAFIAYFIYCLSEGGGVTSPYRWSWAAMPKYLFRYDPESGTWMPNMLMRGLFTTLRLSFWGIILAAVIGTVMGLCRTSRSLFLRTVSRIYVGLIRNLPPLVIVFIFYFFISDQILPFLHIDSFIESQPDNIQKLFGICFAAPASVPPFFSALVTLAVFEGAYITEIVRAGIQSVEKEQWEAARALGFSRWQQLRYIILPQAAQLILPPLSGQFISLIKDSSVVSVISVQELTFMGTELMSATFYTIEIWTLITLLYLTLTLPCSLIAQRIEIAMSRRSHVARRHELRF